MYFFSNLSKAAPTTLSPLWFLPTNSGSLAIFTAIRRASSRWQ
jgi:hypothetical protein